MSDTSRTDCLECGAPDGTHNQTCPHYVVTLQRELSAAQAAGKSVEQKIARLERELAAETEARLANDKALNAFMRKMVRCENCEGSGLVSNHVTGEVECSTCDGTGWSSELVLKLVETRDELADCKRELSAAQFALATSDREILRIQNEVLRLEARLAAAQKQCEQEAIHASMLFDENNDLKAKLARIEAAGRELPEEPLFPEVDVWHQGHKRAKRVAMREDYDKLRTFAAAQTVRLSTVKEKLTESIEVERLALRNNETLRIELSAMRTRAEGNERDAKRYRKARNRRNWSYNMEHSKTPEEFDVACDNLDRACR